MTEQESDQKVDAESDETTVHEEEDAKQESDPTDYQPSSDLPEPTIEPPDPPPGGPDAIEDVGGASGNGNAPLGADPDPSKNPRTDKELPAETTEPDDTDTQATRGEDGTPPEEESPA